MQKGEIIMWVLGVIVAVDLIGFILWMQSGQVPQDNFYVGSITYHVLSIMINK